MFVDEVSIRLKAGKGGDGSASYRREKFVPKGGPDGGDGGRGGDIILECDENVSDLRTYYFKPQWQAGNGGNGMGRGRHGRSGDDCLLKVPCGTLVYPDENRETPVVELLQRGKRHTLLKGGQGGRGNIHFKSSVNQRPRRHDPGTSGEAGDFYFVLKSIADIGLVGYPNAGKSTLIRALTDAAPKTADYPFTTLNPVIGVMEAADTYRRLKIADIPGLIEGAHENRGLGHQFLRHIERCAALVFVLDLSQIEGRHPREDYAALLNEIRAYDEALLQLPRLVVGNKIDEPGAAETLEALRGGLEEEVIAISAVLGESLPELKARMFEFV